MSKSSLYLRDLWVVVIFGLCMECGRLSVFEASLITNTMCLFVGCMLNLQNRIHLFADSVLDAQNQTLFFCKRSVGTLKKKGNFCFVLLADFLSKQRKRTSQSEQPRTPS